ncbi:hypothetical protein BZG78_05925 [Salinivibrio sp. MA351]|uniref:DUF2989 domain-containing protein n=1 Tax=Salinivibrio costicola subsp. alcaliphilus TaxID=272773 RepID=A0ABX3KTN5_SALCS|nr:MULTISPECIES: DUF2989 domain-containing protein [Salinivibrio]OOE94882.1 hypothetical protein BZG75_04550 [Salinivibrio sp. AR640]OOE99965.1 hypothetical protein BZG78_05925 [Salinivibrio sp. MA351]OOF34466.1 hypothetical protein BZJ21_05365 [Salinivibrio costicola subsp. alcaliphilus]
MNLRLLTRYVYRLGLVTSLLLLVGCDGQPTTNQVCETHPELCEGLNIGDGQCRFERSDLIFDRLAVDQKPTDLNKLTELKQTKAYLRCMELVAEIEPTTLKQRKTKRTEAVYHAYDAIARLEDELEASYQPPVIYYRWSQGDNGALPQFLKLEGTPHLETPQLQLGLATYYVSRDKAKTVEILLHALELYDGRDLTVKQDVIPEVIKSLATTNHALKRFEHAYLWAKVGQSYNLPIANSDRLSRLYTLSEQQETSLQRLAFEISAAIDDGNFQASLLAPITQ